MTADELIAHVAGTPRLLVALDFDGTLAPLHDIPMDARMTSAARRAVAAVAAASATTVALVSGRSLADLRVIAEHDDDSPLHLAASHGAESWHPDAVVEGETDAEAVALRDRLQQSAELLVRDREGVWIEPKAVGFALHTRLAQSADGRDAQREVGELMAREAPQWRRRTGRDILEFAFRHEGKDTAVAALRDRLDATAVVFAGDDLTDEDALRSLGEEDLGIHVGDGPTAAAISVPDIDALAALLDRLASLRAARPRE